MYVCGDMTSESIEDLFLLAVTPYNYVNWGNLYNLFAMVHSLWGRLKKKHLCQICHKCVFSSCIDNILWSDIIPQDQNK